MPLFKIRRLVGQASDEDIDAAALRSLWCLTDFPNMKWRHSLWDRDAGELVCLYEAPSVEEIRQHAAASRIPCDEISEVALIDPNEYLHG